MEKCVGVDPETLGHKLCPNRWRQWGTTFAWQQRARDWDREVDRQTREKLIADQIEARARHVRLAQASQAALSIPGRAALMIMQNPAVLQRMVEEGSASTAAFLKILDMVTWSTKNIPGMVEVERVGLGLDTVKEEPGLKPAQTGVEIAQDPTAVELTLKLVTQLANRSLEQQGLALPPHSDTVEGELVPEPDPEVDTEE
jgi:hypothetical protein